MEKKQKFSRTSIASMILCVLIAVAFFLPISTGTSMTDLSLKHAYNLVDVFKIIANPDAYTGGAATAFAAPFIMSCAGLVIAFVAVIVLFVLILRKAENGVRRVLAVCILFLTLFMGLLYNSYMTSIAMPIYDSKDSSVVLKEANNFYEKDILFEIQLKSRTSSPNSWKRPLEKFIEALPEEFTNGEDVNAMAEQLTELKTYSEQFGYDTATADKKKANNHILDELLKMIPVERQQEIFADYFSQRTKEVSAINSTYGVGYVVILLLTVCLVGTCYSERSKEGYKNNGIPATCMFVGLMTLTFALTLFYPIFNASGLTTGLTKTSVFCALLSLPKVLNMRETAVTLGINPEVMNQAWITLGAVLLLVSLVCMLVFIAMAARKIHRNLRKVFGVAAAVLLIAGGLLINVGLGENGVYNEALMEYTGGLTLDGFFFFIIGLALASAIVPFTVYIDKERFKAFSIINVIIFLVVCAFIIVPLWKVLVDSLDAQAGYGLRMWPKEFSITGYTTIVTNVALRRPFLISVLTTLAGTLLGLTLSTLGAYVLIQFEMPGRNFLAGLLLFTMIFQAGMIPTYLLMTEIGLYNSLWVVILLPAMNVYNLVLMRNFFEGIPKSLFESASIDGCTPMGTFIKIVLPLSKAALASIGLMFAVAYWNDYTNYKLYIANTELHNFQMKLRDMFYGSSGADAVAGANTETLQNAAIMVAILPFMIAYPFLQKYFVKGVNVGAVKE